MLTYLELLGSDKKNSKLSKIIDLEIFLDISVEPSSYNIKISTKFPDVNNI